MIITDSAIILRNNKLIEDFRERFNKSKTPIEVKFRDMIPELKSKDRYTHLIHSYPAKLLVHIPYFFLNNTKFSIKGSNVLDPFNGTGTVYLETLLSGRNAFGADANPLARLISKVKATRYDTNELKIYLDKIIKAARKSELMILPEVRNCDMWFSPKNRDALGRLLFQINKIKVNSIKEFMLVCFSNCIKKVSYADPRVSVPVKINAEKYSDKPNLKKLALKRINEINTIDVIEKFNSIVVENIKKYKRLESISFQNNSTNEIFHDARKLNTDCDKKMELKSKTIKLIITSPPYAGAQKYIRSCSLSLGWLGLSDIAGLRELDRKNIGRENYNVHEINILKTGIRRADILIQKIKVKSIERANIACQYLLEMKTSIDEMIRVLNTNGYLVIVIGNNMICDFEFNTQEYLTTYITSKGLILDFKLIDSINSYGLMTKRNKTADIISREYILVFKKY